MKCFKLQEKRWESWCNYIEIIHTRSTVNCRSSVPRWCWLDPDRQFPFLSLQAYRVLEQPDRQKDMTKDDFMERHRAWCCSTFPEQALCGVSRIWVFSLARRQSIATRMLDTVRYDVTPNKNLIISSFLYKCNDTSIFKRFPKLWNHYSHYHSSQ